MFDSSYFSIHAPEQLTGVEQAYQCGERRCESTKHQYLFSSFARALQVMDGGKNRRVVIKRMTTSRNRLGDELDPPLKAFGALEFIAMDYLKPVVQPNLKIV